MSTTFNASKADKRTDDPKNLALTAIMSMIVGLFFFSFILVPMSMYFGIRGIIAASRTNSKKHLWICIAALVVDVPFLLFVTIPKSLAAFGALFSVH